MSVAWYVFHYILFIITLLISIVIMALGFDLFTLKYRGESKVRLYRILFGIFITALGAVTFGIGVWGITLTAMGVK